MFDENTDNPMPEDRGDFTHELAKILKEHLPSCEVEVNGENGIYVNSRFLDTENIYRMTRNNPSHAREMVLAYIDNILKNMPSVVINEDSLSVDEIKTRIMPRIQPESIFQNLNRDNMAYVPFVNNAIIAYVFDAPEVTVSITKDHLERWELTIEEVEELAKFNLANYNPGFEVQYLSSKDGGTCAVISCLDGYDASRLLLPKLFRVLSPKLGGNFYVGIPSRDMFIAASEKPKAMLRRISKRLKQDFLTMPYPIVPDFFYVTLDGVSAGNL